MAGNICWLASYPKSGNTWVRVLLANYLSSSDIPVSINELQMLPVASGRHTFDEYVGTESSDLTAAEIEKYRPQVYRTISEQSEKLSFYKVHDAYTLNEDGLPLFPLSATYGVVYVIRNPLDICLSLAHHTTWPVERVIEEMANPDFTFDGNRYGLCNQLRQKLLSWSEHVKSWIDSSDMRVLTIRYEDLIENTESVLKNIVKHFNLEINLEKIEQAVIFSSFEQLRQQELKQGFREKAPTSQSFFRLGQTGTWRGVLQKEQIRKIETYHEKTMTRFGYFST